MAIGFAGSLVIWIRGRGPAGGLAALFALGGLRQGAMLLADSAWPLPADPLAIGEIALIGAGLAGLVALRSLWRTTRELDRAEDLHWDSMEAVRLLSELAAHPGASLEAKLARVLEIGSARFALDHAIACRLGGAEPEILASRSPDGGLAGADLATALAARLRLAAESPRACAIQGEAGSPTALPDFLGAPAHADGETRCVIAFAGARKSEDRFTATDKDLIGLMAQWLRSELLLRERPEPPRRGAAQTLAAASVQGRLDLNAALRRAEVRLRAQVATDATLELSLAPSLPALRPVPVALETLALSLVAAAHRLSPGGALRVETGRLAAGAAAPEGDAFITLSVRVRDTAIEPDALARAYGDSGAAESDPRTAGGCLPLAQLEALLRRSGADLSMHVEAGRGAVLTAFLPERRPPATASAREHRAAAFAPNP